MVTIPISLEDELAKILHDLAARNSITVETLIKLILEKYVIDLYEVDDPLAGLLDLDERDLAQTLEKLIDLSVMLL